MLFLDRLKKFENVEMSVELELSPCLTTVRDVLGIARGTFLPLDGQGTPRCLLRTGGATLATAEMVEDGGRLSARLLQIGTGRRS